MAPLASLDRDRGLELRAEIPPELPAVFVDRTRIRQILINLLNNAACFTDEGGVTVSAHAEGRAAVVVAVTDTGPGIAPDDLRYVFQEFRQFGDAQQRRGGSGLGLAVSKAFTEIHQGSLSIQSLIVDRSGQIARVFRRYLDDIHVLHLRDLRPTRSGDPVLMPHAVIVGSKEERERWRRASAGMPQWQRVPVMLCPLKTAQRQADEPGVRDYLVKPVTRAPANGVAAGVPETGSGAAGRGQRLIQLVCQDIPSPRTMRARRS
jgi:hypothetical protein